MKCRSAIVVLGGLALSAAVLAADLPKVEVYKVATCGCCHRWAEHLRQQGFTVTTHDVPDVAKVRRQLGMPDEMSGCHTATVGGYAVEGHVPAADIKRMLAEKPNAIGIAVPDMPKGSPGMESPTPVAYKVLLIEKNGSARTYANH